MATLYEAMIKIGVDLSELKSGFEQAQESVNGFGDTAKGVFAGNLLYDGAKKIGQMAYGAAKDAISVGMNFDSAMAQVSATMLKSADEMEQEVGDAFLTTNDEVKEFHGNLREFAQFLGENTAFSATQAAEALNYMALAGYSTQESMTMLPNVLNLAAAGHMDLARASDMVTDAQTALGVEFEDMDDVVDQMAKTASRTNTSVEQLGDAMLTIGGTAKYMKGGPAELSQVLGLLADNGIKGSEAGTHLRNMLLKLSSPTKEGSKYLDAFAKTLGHDLVFDEKTGEMRAFQDIFQDLNLVMSDFTDQQKVQAFSELFNARDVASANALLSTNTERWNEVADAIANADGSASAMSGIQLDNLSGAMQLFKSAVEGAQIAISDRLTPVLTQFVGAGTSMMQRFSTSLREDGVQGVVDTGIEMINELANSISEAAPELIPAAMNALMEFSGGLRENVGNIVDAGLNLIMTLAQSLIDNLPVFIETVPTIISNLAGIINDNAPKLLVAGGQLIIMLVQGIINSVPTLIQEFPKIIQMIIDVWHAVNWVNLGSNIITLIGNGIKALAENLPTLLSNIGKQAVEWMKLIQWSSLGRDIIDLIIIGIRALISAIPTVLRGIGQTAGTVFKSVNWAAVGSAVITFIVSGIRSLISSIPNTLRSIGSSAMSAFRSIDWYSLGSNIISGIVSGITGAGYRLFSSLKNMASNALSAAKSVLKIGSPSKVFRDEIGKWIPEGMAVGISENQRAVDDALANMFDDGDIDLPDYDYEVITDSDGSGRPAIAGWGGADTVMGGAYSPSLENKLDRLIELLEIYLPKRSYPNGPEIDRMLGALL